MNLFQLVLKQMRQRALGTWLTLLSVLLGVSLAVAIFLLQQAGASLFGQTEYGYDVLIGVGQGSKLSLTLNTVYHLYESPGNVPYDVYEKLNRQVHPPHGSTEFNFNAYVKHAIPVAVGDTYKSQPIIGTPPKMFVSLQPLRDRIDALRDKQIALRTDVQNAKAEELAALAPRQQEIEGQLQQIRQELKKVTIESTPLLEQPDALELDAADKAAMQAFLATTQPSATQPATMPAKPIAPPVKKPASGGELLGPDLMSDLPKPVEPEWRYGRPITFKADAAVQDGAAATASLTAHDAHAAVGHENDVLTGLDAIFYSVGAENGPLEYRPDMQYELAEGRVFHAWKFEAVVGSEIPGRTGLKLGDIFQATHGNPGPNDVADVHAEKWRVVGIMKPTHTAADRCVYISLLSIYCIAEHEGGEKAHGQIRNGQKATAVVANDEGPPPYKMVPGNTLDPDLPASEQFINVDTPKSDWEVSAIMIKSRGGNSAETLMYFIKNGGMLDRNVQAINPAAVMREFFETFFSQSTTILLLIAALVSIVAAMSILVSIYNSVSARNREIAILRALGATRGRILTLICLEAGLIGAVGGLAGMLVGHLIGGIGSLYLNRHFGQGFNWVATSVWEWVYLVGVIVIATLAGLVPASKAYRTDVATNLVA